MSILLRHLITTNHPKSYKIDFYYQSTRSKGNDDSNMMIKVSTCPNHEFYMQTNQLKQNPNKKEIKEAYLDGEEKIRGREEEGKGETKEQKRGIGRSWETANLFQI